MKETRQILRFLRKHRMQKKKLLYKKAAGVAFDWVILIYVAIFAGIGLWAAYDFVQESIPMLSTYQDVIHEVLHLLLLAMIVLTITFSFVAPGLPITSAEWKLSGLPFTLKDIWLHLFWRRIGLRVLFFLLVVIVTMPFSLGSLLSWYGMLLAILLLTILPQWYFFQLGIWNKLLLAVIGTAAMAGTRMLLLLYELDITWVWITILAFINLWIWPRKLTRVNWEKVVEKNDDKVWNMFFVQKMSGQVQRKPHLLKGLMTSKRSRLPFDYQNQYKVLRKLWRKAFEREQSQLAPFILCLFIIITAIIFLPPMMQGIVAMIVIFLFVKMTSSFLPSLFQDKLLQSIPWNIPVLLRSFWQMMIGPALITVLLLIGAVVISNPSNNWIVGQGCYFLVAMLYLLFDQLQIRVHLLNNKWYQQASIDVMIKWIIYIHMVVVFIYPFMIGLGLIIIGYWKLRMKNHILYR